MSGTRLVRLYHDHTHAGMKYKAGETVEFPAEVADWILAAEKRIRERRRIAAEAMPGSPEYRRSKQ